MSYVRFSPNDKVDDFTESSKDVSSDEFAAETVPNTDQIFRFRDYYSDWKNGIHFDAFKIQPQTPQRIKRSKPLRSFVRKNEHKGLAQDSIKAVILQKR